MEYCNENKRILEINKKDVNGQYPLFYAIKNKNNNIIEFTNGICKKK